MIKVLVTGFEPFGGKVNNTSWDVVEQMPLRIADAEIVKVRIPVSFVKAPETLNGSIECLRPDVVVMLGEAKPDSKLRIERVALNLMDSSKQDNDGWAPVAQKAHLNGETAYMSPFDVRSLVDSLKSLNHDSVISNSAGTFVCNRLYYEALQARHNALFVHVPHRESGVALNDLADTVCDLIKLIVRNSEKV